MSFLLRHINFDSDAIVVELVRLSSSEDLDEVRDFLHTASGLGFSSTVLYAPARAKDIARNLIETLRRQDGVTVAKRAFKRKRVATTSKFRLHGAVDYPERGKGNGEPRHRYTIDLTTDSEAIDNYVSCIRLIAAAHSLKANRLLDLRFSTYELLTNTLQHGVFSNGSPQVSLSVVMTQDSINLVYKDNADPFDADIEENLNVGVLIKRKARRGLGLWLIQKLASELTFEREGEWNVTRLRLARE